MSLDSINEELSAHIPRDRWGRPKVQPPGGGKEEPYTRATTVADTLDDRYNLELWKMRQVALGLGTRPDLMTMVKAHTATDKSILNDVCKQAMDAAASKQGANLGTALHNVTVQADLGLPYDQDFDHQIQQYHALLEEAGFETNHDFIERFVVCDAHKVGGSFDRLLFHRAGRKHKVGDIKCGAGIDYGQRSFAVQLAIYAHGVFYNPKDHSRSPLPDDIDLEEAIIIHLPSAGGEPQLWRLDIAAGWEAFEHAMWVRGWRQRNVMKAIPRDLTPQLEASVKAEIAKLPPAQPPELTVVKDPDLLDPRIYRPKLTDWFKLWHSGPAVKLYAEWRRRANGNLEFKPPNTHRFNRIRAAWRLATIVADYDEHANAAANAIVATITEIVAPVWDLDPFASKALLNALMQNHVDIAAVFNDDGPVFTITLTPTKGGDT